EVNLIQDNLENLRIILSPVMVDRIIGQVKDARTKAGIQGATVWIEQYEQQFSTTSKSTQGIFELHNIPLYLQPEGGFTFVARYIYPLREAIGKTTLQLPYNEPVFILIEPPKQAERLAAIMGTAYHLTEASLAPAGGEVIGIQQFP